MNSENFDNAAVGARDGGAPQVYAGSPAAAGPGRLRVQVLVDVCPGQQRPARLGRERRGWKHAAHRARARLEWALGWYLQVNCRTYCRISYVPGYEYNCT